MELDTNVSGFLFLPNEKKPMPKNSHEPLKSGERQRD
jgi:hypothetical protein